MKKILGLDLGTNSIGWAVVNEAETTNEQSSITKLGVRVISYDNFVSTKTGKESKEPVKDFVGGKSISCNAGRTLKRSMRRNLQRYKLRRKNLIELLKQHGFITDETILSENGNRTTFETYRLRAKAATEEISLQEFARVLLMINKKRGYKSSRKVKSTDEGQAIDSIDVAKKLYDDNLTPGQYALQLLERKQKNLPDFYRSDLQNELNKVLDCQKQFYPEIITEDFKEQLNGKNGKQTWILFRDVMKVEGPKRETKGAEQRLENYKWRVKALSQKLDLEQIAVVLQEINGQITNASGYLGNISDRSKVLRLNHLTVGQYQMQQLDANPHYSLKNQVFYRQDYLDEFETIWETQAKFHKELTTELKDEIRDVVIFYQRKLKSQKGLISYCEFESRQVEYEENGKKKTRTIGLKVCPKSSPLFQEFRIWQRLNDVIVSGKRPLTEEEKQELFNQLTVKEKLSKTEVIKLLFANVKDADIKFKELDGNRTLAKIYNVLDTFKIDRKNYKFDSSVEGKDFEKQPIYQLWHLLYSFEGEDNELIKKLTQKFGFNIDCAKALANPTFESDYGNLSAKALRKILPHLKDGLNYSTACEYAGYRHSKNSLTKEEIDNKVLKNTLDLLPKNSLRNPVVEKILNQMVNVVNGIIAEYGKPDEIRIELARELKKSQTEREEMAKSMSSATTLHEKYVKELQQDFGLKHVSRNDLIRYKLYLELAKNGFKTLYSNTYIPKSKLFSKEFDIEHIIPQASLFDDSFSNKTLEARQINIDKGKMTAFDFVSERYGENGAIEYKNRIDHLYAQKVISKTKHDKLLMKEADIPSGFINRDLRDSQYIAKKAKEMLESIVKYVVTTTGSVTDRLREDWQLVNVMQELNWDKYDKLGLTEIEEDTDYNGNKYKIRKIKDWTKRNDHRHHAMDALTIAFTKRSFIQYLNNLNARIEKTSDVYVDLDNVEFMDLPKEQRAGAVFAIERTQLYRDDKGKLRFNPPMPLDEFRAEAKRQLENILVSIKAKNKVVTRNVNVFKTKSGKKQVVQLTPRGQLHNESIYGSYKKVVVNVEKVNASFDAKKIATVTSPRYREALLARLESYGNDPKKAFTGKNALDKNPLWLNDLHTDKVPDKVKTVTYEVAYTIRKPISSDLNVDKVVDSHIKTILEERLKEYGGDTKQAFSNLDENPIWLNKSKGIALKRVTISGVNNVEALHSKHDKDGKLCWSKDGLKQPVDFVSPSNNHHVAIYRKPILGKDNLPQTDDDGNIKYELDEKIVSFYEATSRAMLGLPIIDREYKKEEGWQFLFTMKQNEYFVFPEYDENGECVFNPKEYDESWFKNTENYSIISPHLLRVQKLATKDYFFRHHLETTVQDAKPLKGVTWKRCGLQGLGNIVKVRINHIGQIVSVGEY